MRCEDCREALNSYIDGEVPADESEMMREHVTACAGCRAERDMLTALSTRVKASLEPVPAPRILEARIRSALAQSEPLNARQPARWRWPSLIAAALLIAIVSSGVSLSVARRELAPTSVADEVLSSHIRSLMPGHLTDVASNDQHNVKPWFNGRLDLSPSVPRFDSAGFVLTGGRLDYLAGRPVAVVVYTRRQHIINVFSWPDGDRGSQSRSQTPSLSTTNGYHLVHWSRDGTQFWAASDVSTPDLQQFVALFARSDSAERAK